MDIKTENKPIIPSFEDLLVQLDSSSANFLQAFEAFKPEQINTIPFEDSWTAAQVADHISISLTGILEVLQGESKLTVRDVTEKVQRTADMFLDFTVKFMTSPSLFPSDKPIEKEILMQRLRTLFSSLKKIAIQHDLSQTCTISDLPVIGALTKIEWLYFTIFHGERHTFQLKNIKKYFPD